MSDTLAVTRLFRVVGSRIPTDWDFVSHWDRGHRPRPYRKSQERAYRGVSTFETLELAWVKADANDLGDFVAELEIPDEVVRVANGRGHVNLEGTTPRQLQAYVVCIHIRSSI